VSDVRTGKRFPVQLPVRVAGGDQQGTTDNVSASGAYFVVDRGFEVGSMVEFEITIPRDVIGATEDARVRCIGRVIRNEEREQKKTGIACVIDSYEFVRSESPEA